MAKNWTAYEAAKEIYGENKENITEIGSRFPLLTRTVAMANSEYVLTILEALPKVTARALETGLKENTSEIIEDDIEEEGTKPVKTKKAKAVEEDEETSTYEEMTGKELYALCCKRGISSLCKSRSKDALIELLNKFDNGELETKEEKKVSKTKTKAAPKKVEEEVEDEDWEDEEEEDSDPYAGKNARELFAMCKERGIKAKPKQNASVYADLLKADDAKAEEVDTEDEEDDDDWEI